MIYLWVLIVFCLVIYISSLAMLFWSFKELRVDVIDLIKNEDSTNEVARISREVFLEHIKLFFWEVKRRCVNQNHQKKAQEIAQTPNEFFDDWSLSGKKMTISIITNQCKDFVDVENISINLPDESLWKIRKLFIAINIITFLCKD